MEFSEELNDDLDIVLNLAYNDVRDLCVRNGLVLDYTYYLSDGGTEKYHPSILPLKNDKGNIQEVSIGYFDYYDNVIAFIKIDVKSKEIYLDSDFWEIEDADNLSIALKKGGGIEDRGIRPSPKESATIFKAGTRKKGQDGDMWEVTVAKNGVKRWKKISGGSGSKPKREKKPIPKKKGKKEKESEWKERKIQDYDEEYQMILRILEDDLPDKTKIDIIKDKIGDFLMYYDLPLIEDYFGTLWNKTGVIPFNLIDYRKQDDKFIVLFTTINKDKKVIHKESLTFNEIDLLKRFQNSFTRFISNGSFYNPIYEGYEKKYNSAPEIIAKVIFNYSTKDFHSIFVRDLYKRMYQADFGHDWLEYVRTSDDVKDYLEEWSKFFETKYKVGDKFVVKTKYEKFNVGDEIVINEANLIGGNTFYELESKDAGEKITFLNWTDSDIDKMLVGSKTEPYPLWGLIKKQSQPEKKEYKRSEPEYEKTGVNDWIADITHDKPAAIFGVWGLYRDGKYIEWGSEEFVGGYVNATPEPEKNITQIIYVLGDKQKSVIVKTLKTGTFQNLQEYVDAVTPYLSKINNILRFDYGGAVDNGNLYMLKNQAVQFKHHAEELDDALEKEPKIDAWVVAKAERAATDLSDITHYLDGKSEKYARGGGIDRREMLEKELRRLQRELNSPRLQIYTEGDDSEEQKARFREREVKLARFNEILDLLRQMDEKYEDGGDILDQDTLSRLDNPDLADASAYNDGGEIRSKEEIQKLYKEKVEYVKTLKPEQVVNSWNRNSWSVVNGYQQPIKQGEYKPELRMYLANLLFEIELTEDEYRAYLRNGGYVRKTPATFNDKVRAISKRLEGTQVAPKYRSEYGRYYDKEESLTAARKIAGKMIQDEKKR